MITAGAVFPRRLVRDTVTRALVLWAGLRLGLLAIRPFTGVPVVGPAAFLWVEVLAIALVQSDLRVCRETVLLANLGVSRLQIFAVTLPVVSLAEVGLQAILLLLLSR